MLYARDGSTRLRCPDDSTLPLTHPSAALHLAVGDRRRTKRAGTDWDVGRAERAATLRTRLALRQCVAFVRAGNQGLRLRKLRGWHG